MFDADYTAGFAERFNLHLAGLLLSHILRNKGTGIFYIRQLFKK